MLNELLSTVKSSDLTGSELVIGCNLIDGVEFSIVMSPPYKMTEDRGQVEIKEALLSIDESEHELLLSEVVDSSINQAANAIYTALVLHDTFIKDGA